ncbi:acyltransferase family protein [Blastopirellula marina]|uniref:Acyltransferase 3 domain-containing protein n=1 Tax=Blastopirellula marina TaxID=124 RepID=A0A2S8GIN4_9BACT|nr:acyltransferase [Blastopirellula marina]PQO43894.1 hypothetical protein C5Y93_22170 [Blastopirellula marina]
MKPDETSLRENNFDVIRFILACAVVFSHSYALGLGDESGEPFNMMLGVSSGNLAVKGFFVISGFLILRSWDRRRSWMDYLRKRIVRIYPGWLAVNVLTIAVLASLSITTFSEVVAWLPKAVLLWRFQTAGAFEGNAFPEAINGSLWSIPFEFACYLLLLALGLLGVLARTRWLLAATALTLLTSLAKDLGGAFDAFQIHPTIGRTVATSSFFLVGACAYRLRDFVQYNWIGAACCFLGLCVTSFVPLANQVILPITLAYLLFGLAFQRRVCLHRFGKHGDFSYGIYLYAFPIQQIIVWSQGGTMNPLALFAISAPLSIAAGIGSWFAVERWFLSRRRLKPMETASPSPASEDTRIAVELP